MTEVPGRRVSQRLVATWAEGPAVEIKQVVKTYFTGTPDEVRALDGIQARFQRGKLNVLWGPSASGKTTLLSLMGCLDRATSGEVLVGGLDLARLTAPQRALYRRHRMGFVFQNPNFLEDVPLWANITLSLVPEGVPPARRREVGREALGRVGLGEKWERTPLQLSGGEAQRAAVARALLQNPPLVLADEPTSQLDEASGVRVLEILETLTLEGRTVIVSSHDPRVRKRAGRVYYLKAGRLEAEEDVR